MYIYKYTVTHTEGSSDQREQKCLTVAYVSSKFKVTSGAHRAIGKSFQIRGLAARYARTVGFNVPLDKL